MNTLEIVLAFFSVLVAAVVIYLGVRLFRKEAELRALTARTPGPDGSYPPGDSVDVTVTDQFLYDRCCRYMVERRPFLVENYTLQDLSNAMYTNRYYVSKIINRFSGKHFRAYVNYYRVMYAMELYRSNMSLRISEMAHLCGFKSSSSFLSAFKSVMGEPPSDWCARIRKKYRQPS